MTSDNRGIRGDARITVLDFHVLVYIILPAIPKRCLRLMFGVVHVGRCCDTGSNVVKFVHRGSCVTFGDKVGKEKTENAQIATSPEPRCSRRLEADGWVALSLAVSMGEGIAVYLYTYIGVGHEDKGSSPVLHSRVTRILPLRSAFRSLG